jgi:hypothetical protein
MGGVVGGRRGSSPGKLPAGRVSDGWWSSRHLRFDTCSIPQFVVLCSVLHEHSRYIARQPRGPTRIAGQLCSRRRTPRCADPESGIADPFAVGSALSGITCGLQPSGTVAVCHARHRSSGTSTRPTRDSAPRGTGQPQVAGSLSGKGVHLFLRCVHLSASLLTPAKQGNLAPRPPVTHCDDLSGWCSGMHPSAVRAARPVTDGDPWRLHATA